jgi:hypothetical protein
MSEFRLSTEAIGVADNRAADLICRGSAVENSHDTSRGVDITECSDGGPLAVVELCRDKLKT